MNTSRAANQRVCMKAIGVAANWRSPHFFAGVVAAFFGKADVSDEHQFAATMRCRLHARWRQMENLK